MQYSREFIPLKECTSGFGRGGMVPHGIARMERHEDAVKLRVNIYGLSPGAGPYSVYAISMADTTFRKVELGQLQPDSLGRCELGYRSLLRGDEQYRIRVVMVALADGTEVLVGYVGEPVDWHGMQDIDAEPDLESAVISESEPPEEPMAIEEEPLTEAMSAKSVTELVPEPEAIVEEVEPEAAKEVAEPMIEFARHEEEAEDSEPITSQAAAKDALQYMFQAYPRIYPFRDTETRWIRIHPRDIAPLPIDAVALEASPFLQRGYLQYKHLILGSDGDAYYLGVPFRYNQDQEAIGHNWGFQEFRNSFGSVPIKGDYGYWIMPIRFQEAKIA